MKFIMSILALASIAYSQTIASEIAMLPVCALTCLAPAVTSAGCGLTDYACQCGTAKNAIAQAATPCIISSCSSDDALKIQSVATQLCALVAGSGSGSGSSPTAGSVTSASSMASSATSRASSVVSSANSRASTATAGTVTTSSPTTATGAASREGVGAVVAGAALLAALAL